MGFTPSATSLQAPAESRQGRSRLSIGEIQTAQHSSVSVVRSAEAQPSAAVSVVSPKDDRLLIPIDNNCLLYGDEFRHPATFNYSRIMWYLDLVDDVFRALNRFVVASQVGSPAKCLVIELVSPVFNRKRGLSPRSPLLPRKIPRFLKMHSGRCSERRFSPFFSSVE